MDYNDTRKSEYGNLWAGDAKVKKTGHRGSWVKGTQELSFTLVVNNG